MTDKQATATYHGGAAFPTPSKLGVNDTSTWIAEIPGQPGMTLRDYFAAKAMREMTWADKAGSAQECYEMADAMLRAREQ